MAFVHLATAGPTTRPDAGILSDGTREIEFIVRGLGDPAMLQSLTSWNELQTWLNRERTLSLPRGKPFRTWFDPSNDEIVCTPSETGIERRIGRAEWHRFVERFNEVEKSGYNPLRAGHYHRVSFNSSYLVAIAKVSELNRHPRRKD